MYTVEVQTQLSQQLDKLSYDLVQAFKMHRGRILMTQISQKQFGTDVSLQTSSG